MSNLSPKTSYLRISQLVGDPQNNIPPIIPVCRATIWKWVRDGMFPKPLKIGPAVTVWRASDIEEFLDEKGGDHAI